MRPAVHMLEMLDAGEMVRGLHHRERALHEADLRGMLEDACVGVHVNGYRFDNGRVVTRFDDVEWPLHVRSVATGQWHSRRDG